MKKLLLSLGATVTAIAPLAAVVACGDDVAAALPGTGVDKGKEVTGEDKADLEVVAANLETANVYGLATIGTTEIFRNGDEFTIIVNQPQEIGKNPTNITIEFTYNFKTKKIIAIKYDLKLYPNDKLDAHFIILFKDAKYTFDLIKNSSDPKNVVDDDFKSGQKDELKKILEKLETELAKTENTDELDKLNENK